MWVLEISDANLQEYENMENMPRPEEDREIEIEKNKRLQQQLRVITAHGYLLDSYFISHHLWRIIYPSRLCDCLQDIG